MTRRIIAVVGGIGLFVALGFVIYWMQQAGGLMDYTSFGRTGHTQWKVLFLLLTRLSFFPIFGLAFIAWGFGWKRTYGVSLFLGIIAVILNGISMVVIVQEPW